MSSDRNAIDRLDVRLSSLVDWDMSSDRNTLNPAHWLIISLVDWDMSSDRNRIKADMEKTSV